MQAFRDMVKGWLGKALLGVIVLLMALLGIESYFSGGNTPVAAEVNGQEIYEPQLENLVENQRQQLMARMGNAADPSQIDNAKLRKEVLDDLVRRELLAQQAKKDGFLISDVTIAKLIQENQAFQGEDGKFSAQRYEQVLRQMGETPAGFPAKAKQTIAIAQLAAGIGQSAFVTAADVNKLSALDNQKRDVHVAMVSSLPYLAGITISDADIKKYYDAHSKKFTTQELLAIEYIELNRADFLAKATVSEEELQNRYAEQTRTLSSNEQRHAAHILISIDEKVKAADALKKVQGIEQRVKAGEDFAALAREFSQDPGSVAAGGDLGFAGRGQFVPEFETVLFALKPGQVSAPVKTQFGYHLIKLLETQQAEVPSFASMRADLEKEAKAAKAEELFGAAGDKLDAAAYEASDLKDPAAQAGLSVQSTGLFTQKGGEGLAADPKIVAAAFSDDVLKDGKNSQAIHLDNGRAVWLRVKEHKPAALRALSEVSNEIRNQLTLDQAAAKAKQVAEAAAKALSAGATPADVAKQYQLQWNDMAAIDRRTSMPSPAVTRAAFRVPAPAAGKLSATVEPLGSSYAVVAVSRVVPGTANLAGAELAQMVSVLGENRGQQEFQDYVEYLKAKGKVKIRENKKSDEE